MVGVGGGSAAFAPPFRGAPCSWFAPWMLLFLQFSSLSYCAWQKPNTRNQPPKEPSAHFTLPLLDFQVALCALWNVNRPEWNPSWIILRATRASSDGEQGGTKFLLKYKGSIQQTHRCSTKSYSCIRSTEGTGPSAKTIWDLCSVSCGKWNPRKTTVGKQAPPKVQCFFS